VDDVDRLFEVEPGEFVRERNALADRLKKEGRADEAAEVRRLRKPSAAVWALNQLARRRPDDVAALIDAGERVRRVQQQGGGNLLREATREVQVLARGLAAGTTRPSEVEAGLRAAAMSGDPDGELRAGRLTVLPEAPLGPEMWVAPAEPEAAHDERESKDLREARARLARAEAERGRARSLVDDAEELLARRLAALDEAEERLAEARRQVPRSRA
jgi:hypothetical protein